LCLIYTKNARASRKMPGLFWPTPGATRKKRFLGPQWGSGDLKAVAMDMVTVRLWWHHSLYKNLVKTPKLTFCRLTIQEPIFSVPNTEFEGGGDGHGHGEGNFLVKYAQPSHNRRFKK
jgi:hypothetical protein